MNDAQPDPAAVFVPTHIWKSEQYDWPCAPTGREWRDDATGLEYLEVLTEDGNTRPVPKDEVVAKADGAGAAEAAVDANVGDAADAGQATLEILEKAVEGDFDRFIARAAEDPGFPFEPPAIAALVLMAADEQRLADYQRLRARLKAETDVVVTSLDDAVKKAAARNSGTGAEDGLPGQPVTFEDIEPWSEPVEGGALVAEGVETIGRYMVMGAHQLLACVLWIIHAHSHDLRDVSPPLVVKSPAMRSGKTRLMEVLERAVPRPLYISGLTAAFVERAIETFHPTVLIDEYDALTKENPALAEAARAQLNRSSRRRGARVGKNVPLPGGGYEPRVFSTWAATAIAGIGAPPPTVADRAVPLDLKRKLAEEKVQPLRERGGADLADFRRKIARWVGDNETKIRNAEPKPPLEVDNDRAKDMWEPLLAIADIAGGEWPARARAAGKALVEASERLLVETNIDALLFCDIRDIFADAFPAGHSAHAAEASGRPDDGPRMATKQLLAKLHLIEERPWEAWGKAKKPITDRQLGDRLRPYGVRSGTVRVEGGGTAKGYYLKAFADPFRCYAPSPPSTPPNSDVTPSQSPESGRFRGFSAVTNSEFVTAENPRKAPENGVCDVVTAQKGGAQGERGAEAPDGPLAGALANLIPRSGEWVAAPSDLVAGIGRGPGFPKNEADLIAWIERSTALLAAHGVEVGFTADGVGDLIVLRRVEPPASKSGGAPALRALDLYCCAGGATKGLQLAGFHVTGVDIAPQPNYCGDAFIHADALKYLRAADLSLFDFIWASPPCQAHTVLKHAPGTKEHVDLIAPTRELLMRSGKPWAIENVEGAPLINPVTLCGTMFGLKTPGGVELRRHRLFETSFPLVMAPSCQHGDGGVIGIYGGHFRDRRRPTGENHRSGSNLPREHGFIAMGVDWPMTTAEISEAIPPAYSHYVAKQWLAQANAKLAPCEGKRSDG
jgi:hypothetical protein